MRPRERLQSHQDGIRAWCEAPRRCEDCRDSIDHRLNDLHRYVDDELSNAETKALFASLTFMHPSDRAEQLEAEARRVGLTSCPMVDTYREVAARLEPDGSR